MQLQKMLAIVGETASGKSNLALTIAERWNGEIIAADSRTVYKGMDIGTAKPSRAVLARIHHHLLDIVEPNQAFTAADFQRQAKKAIAGLHSRHKLPILAGGTGLYIDSVLYDFDFRPVVSHGKRTALETLSVEELQQQIQAKGLPMPYNDRNPRHLIRILETDGHVANRKALSREVLLVGLSVDRKELERRIVRRAEDMLAAGLEAEVRALWRRYGWQSVALRSAIGYQEFQPYFAGHSTIEDVQRAIIRNTMRYAKKQRTWFKRNPDILWCESAEQALRAAEDFLSNSPNPGG